MRCQTLESTNVYQRLGVDQRLDFPHKYAVAGSAWTWLHPFEATF
jgi:hypothetical protein